MQSSHYSPSDVPAINAMKTFAFGLAVGAAGHSQMYEPPARTTMGLRLGTPYCAGGSCLWFNNGAFIGCPKSNGKDHTDNATCPDGPSQPHFDMNDKRLSTVFNDGNPKNPPLGDWTAHHPWRAPGSAPIENSCGLNGGFYYPGPCGTGGLPVFGFKQGHKGTEVSPLLKKTTWVAGSTVEVAWGITANHGGGYQYRICRIKKESYNVTEEATEECFQRTPLEFVGDKQWIQFGDGMDRNNRTEVTATRVTEGVLPRGSTWTKNPIPACNDIPRLGGHNHECAGPMFPPPAPGVYGFGVGSCATGVESEKCTVEESARRVMPFGIVDKVRIPDVPPGDYIVSFRWDCQQLPQVWLNCADVKIVSPGKEKPTKAFSPWWGCEACCAEMKGACSNCTKCVNDKSGDCAYCWNSLPGFTFGAVPKWHCLGYEAPDGGATNWKPGMPIDGGYSPGCSKCWSEKDSCKVSDREVEDKIDDLVV